MKSKLLKSMKRIVSSVVAIAIVVTGGFVTSVGANASETSKTETTSSVQYIEYGAQFDYDSYLDGNRAPEYKGDDTAGFGYLFGGWYIKDGNNYTAIKETADLPTDRSTIVAKFVPAQVLSVKCQNWAGTNADSDKVVIRVISAVDSKSYSMYGFKVSKIVDGVVTELGTYSPEEKPVYTKFNYYKNIDDTEPTESYIPSDLFGSAAGYFTSCTVGYVSKGNHDKIICIKPFWVTLDGTEVEGLSKYAHVEDGYLGYVNVPVNLNILSKDNGAAAGLLSVKYDENALEFLGVEDGVENGKVFDEIAVNKVSDGVIKCVGNTFDASDKTKNDIYINLKFKKLTEQTNDAPEKNKFYEFSVTGEDFCNNAEQSTAPDVWNIKY